MADPFVTQHRSKALILLPAKVPHAGSQRRTNMVVLPRIRAVSEIVGRVIEVQIFAIPAVNKVLHIKGSAHGDNPGDLIRVAESEVRSMKRAEAATGGDQSRRLVLFAHQGHYIVHDVALVPHVPLPPPIGVRLLVVPAFPVYAIDAKEL